MITPIPGKFYKLHFKPTRKETLPNCRLDTYYGCFNNLTMLKLLRVLNDPNSRYYHGETAAGDMVILQIPGLCSGSCGTTMMINYDCLNYDPSCPCQICVYEADIIPMKDDGTWDCVCETKTLTAQGCQCGGK